MVRWFFRYSFLLAVLESLLGAPLLFLPSSALAQATPALAADPGTSSPPSVPAAEQRETRKTGMSSWGARALPTGAVVADLGTGYPNIFMARLTVGALNPKPGPLDLGIEVNTFFQMSTLAVQSRLQLASVGPLSAAVRADMGAGAGAKGKNTFFVDVQALASLDLADVVTFSGDVRFSYWNDQFCPSQQQVDSGGGQEDYCRTTAYPEFNGISAMGRRFSDYRVYAGLTAVAAVNRRVSLFARLDFLPLAGIAWVPQPRMAYLDRFNSVMFAHDPLYYGNVGVSLKF